MRQRKKVSNNIVNSPKVVAVDLFCGVGGLTHGLAKAGIDVRLGIDIDPACEFPYCANNKAIFLKKSVEDVKAEDIAEKWSDCDIRVLAGCAPCQTFSTYNQKADVTDKRWWLLLQFSRLIGELLPEIVTMENVPKVVEHIVFQDFLIGLQNVGYHVSHQIVNCAEYGLPQHRQRLVLLASKFSKFSLLTPKEFGAERQSVRMAIADLPSLIAGQVDKNDPLHQTASLSALNLKRIKMSKPGGTWRDWDKTLIAECHKKTTGKTYSSVYARMTWDEQAPTITTQYYGFGNGRFGHPEQDRALSLREGAILQSFPEDYIFTSPEKPIHKTIVGRLIGNAVPVRLGEVIGESIIQHIASQKPQLHLKCDLKIKDR